MKQLKRKSDCPINFALELFGDKWTFLVVRDLMFKGKHFYGEFLSSGEKIATNTLADRLVLLENNGIISRSSDQSHKQKVKYSLTRKGVDLVPVLIEMILWSAKYDKLTAADAAFIKAARKDKAGLISDISGRLVTAMRAC